ncbi:hypothetical protein [Streptomyces sp. TRM68367]|uniref:hypothetical protein n=1 Tax=Streptomyces sp. TRM68367 TaxID=2758415 RepID=UPI00165AEAA5|nr:hypothetical protein [Streptomyces sp. TRM68367]MBC9728953.1 hypothetical protein [Streptomyces sp. TRM68367]
MDCTATTGTLLLVREDGQARSGGPARASHGHPPIYAALVAEWQADGRTVPGAREALWTACVSGAACGGVDVALTPAAIVIRLRTTFQEGSRCPG